MLGKSQDNIGSDKVIVDFVWQWSNDKVMNQRIWIKVGMQERRRRECMGIGHL
jgi:hypothetical protein